MKPRDVRITVLRKLEIEEVYTEFAAQNTPQICSRMREEYEFVSRGMQMPSEFCSWAWADIQREVVFLALGGNYPWIRQSGTEIVCCGDGLHLVLYKLERMEET